MNCPALPIAVSVRMRTFAFRWLSISAAVLLGAVAATEANAQSAPMRWIVPVAAGGALDITARLLQEPVGRALGATIVVENRTGGAGVIATEAVVRAAPDGNTLGMIYTSHAANVVLLPKLPYDSVRGITPIALLWRSPTAIAVTPGTKFTTLSELIAAAKAAPRTISYATSSVATSAHFTGALLEQVAGVSLIHVPYRGVAPALSDVIAGHIPVLIGNVSSILPAAEAGKLKVLAVSGATRSPTMPDVPTVAELGYSGFEIIEWMAVIGPAGIPSQTVNRLNRAILDAIDTPLVAERYRSWGYESPRMTPEQLGNYLQSQTGLIGGIIRKAGIKAEQ